MAKYVYPAVFTPEKKGYSVAFPDLENCHTCEENLMNALVTAEETLAFVLYGYEADERKIPEASKREDIVLEKGQFVNYIACDTIAYAKKHNNKAVKKTLTVPEWLNEAATKAGVNFSQVLQEALIEKIR